MRALALEDVRCADLIVLNAPVGIKGIVVGIDSNSKYLFLLQTLSTEFYF